MNDNRKYKYDLHDRLIEFAVNTMKLVEKFPNTRIGNHIAGQLLRCGTSSAPNYAEAQGAESSNDFIHKINICLKELRESLTWLRIINEFGSLAPPDKIKFMSLECEELIRIFQKSVMTAKRNKVSVKPSIEKS